MPWDVLGQTPFLREYCNLICLLHNRAPLPLFLRQDLLSQLEGSVWHLGHLQFHVWPQYLFCSDICRHCWIKILQPLHWSCMLLLCLYLSARHTFVDGRLVGSQALVSRFLKGELLLRPPHTLWVCSRDLVVVLGVSMFYFLSPLLADLRQLSGKSAHSCIYQAGSWASWTVFIKGLFAVASQKIGPNCNCSMWPKCNCYLTLSCSTSNGTLRFLLCSVRPTPYFRVKNGTKAVPCPSRGSHIGLLMPYPMHTGSVASRFPGQEHLHVMGQLEQRFTDWHLCCSFVGFLLNLCLLLQSEWCHCQFSGDSCVFCCLTKSHWVSLSVLMAVYSSSR